MPAGSLIATRRAVSAGRPGRSNRGSNVRRTLWVVLAVMFVLAAGLGIGTASDRDETIITVEVGSADHELQEGYFTLGEHATVMAKPGSDLYKFLTRQRGRKVKITMSEAGRPELSRLER